MYRLTTRTAALKAMSQDDVQMRCVDKIYRRCFSILATMMTDYEKQILITSIKMNQQCSICQVSLKERENLMKQWSLRTHEYTQEQIQRQKYRKTSTSDKMYVHIKENFAWYHKLINIHDIMMMNILHQLHKEIIMNFITWIVDLLNELYSKFQKRKREESKRSMKYAHDAILLNYRFQQVSSYQEMKVFKNFSFVSQWTKVEQKALIHQLIAVVISLLSKKRPEVMKCIRAFLNFVMLA